MLAKQLTKNSMSFAFTRESGLGIGLLSFGNLLAFLDPAAKKLHTLSPLPFKTQKLHIKEWMASIRENAPSVIIAEYEQVTLGPDDLSKALDVFLRLS